MTLSCFRSCSRSWMLTLALCLAPAFVHAQFAETNRLIGVHFPDDLNTTGGVAGGAIYTDVEALFGDTGGPVGSSNIAGNGGGWILDTVVTDAADNNAPFYQQAYQNGVFGPLDKTQPGYMTYSIRRMAALGAKNSTAIVRLQPAYGRNVPFDTALSGVAGPSDPYTVANYAADAKSVTTLLKDHARYYVVGNECNLNGTGGTGTENNRYTSGGNYTTAWQPTPEQYAATYATVRDQMHTATTGTAGAPVVLMQPPSPSLATAGVAYDGNEFLWRQIKYVNSIDPNKIDGFALHSYAEPGGANSGTDGFMDSLREQLCIISYLGHGNKPVFVTEFNKDMPNTTEEQVGCAFVGLAYSSLNSWNSGFGGLIPSVPNPGIIGTNWFLYPSAGPNVTDGFNRQSLRFWKTNTGNTNPANNIWYAFQNTAATHYTRGTTQTATAWPLAAQWWRDDFSGATLDTTPALPDWFPATANGGSYSLSGGKISFFGNNNTFGSADVRTRGYAFGDFTFATKFTFTNAAKAASGSPEANFDIRLREGSTGYSMTFFSTPSPANSGHIILRRTSIWTTIGSFDVAVPGGINTGDTFEVRAVANGDNLTLQAFKNSSGTPIMTWNVSDPAGQKVGWVRFGTYAINQVDVDYATMGGKNWDFTGAAAVDEWTLY